MIRFTSKYISRIPQVKTQAKIDADQLVRWGCLTLQAEVRLAILGWPTGPIVDTGNMLASVGFNMLAPAKGEVFVGAEYAHFVNNGTSKRAGRPFFDQAVKAFAPQFRGAVKRL